MLLLFSHLVVSNSFRPHGLQYPRPPCPSLTPEVCPSSCPLHWWCHPVISSSEALFSFYPQSFPWLKNWLSNESAVCIRWPKYWSFSFSIHLSNKTQGWFSLRLTGLIFLLSKRLSGVFSSTLVQRYQFFSALPSLWSSSHYLQWFWSPRRGNLSLLPPSPLLFAMK